MPLLYPDMPKPIYAMRHGMFEKLSEIDYINLIHRYYHGEKPTALLKEYDLKGSAQKFTSNLPYFYDYKVKCKHCNVPMTVRGRLTLGNGQIMSAGKYRCQVCSHEYGHWIECHCDECTRSFQNVLDADIAQKSANAKSNTDYLSAAVNIKLILAAILRSGQDEHDITLIHPDFLGMNTKLAPSSDMAENIIATLIRSGWLRFDEKNPENCFTIEDKAIASYKVFKMRYRLNVTNEFSLFSQMLSPDFSNANEFDLFLMHVQWRDIAIEECLEYLEYQLEQYNLNGTVGQKTEHVIWEALKHFSTSQVFNFIWGSVKDAAAYYQKDRITKQHAVNSIPNKIQKRFENALAEDYDIKPFGRDYNLPQSKIADVLYDKALKIGNRGFTSVIPIEAFDEKL